MPDSDFLSAQSHLELEERVRKRAHEIWEARQVNNVEGSALDDWLAAEREVLGADPHQPAQDRGTVVGSARRPDREQIRSLTEP